MDCLASPTYNSPNGDFAMQKYLLLQNQHDELQQHMYNLCPTYSNSTAVTSPSVSPSRSFTSSPPSVHSSLSPSRNHRRSSGHGASMRHKRGSSISLAPVLDEDLMEEMAADEQKLCDVNESLKRALTELLNCDAVRNDRTMRVWVQTRLMDTERELRTGRRRRSGGGLE